jgi:ribosomal protein L9
MKLILLERVEGWGQLGDVVSVKDGYARNYLLPRKKALRATKANEKVFEAQRAEIEARNAKAKEAAGRAGEKLDGTSYILIPRRARAASSTARSPAATWPRRSAPKAARWSARWSCWTSRSRRSACTR